MRYEHYQIAKTFGVAFFYEKIKKLIIDALKQPDINVIKAIIKKLPDVFELISKIKDEKFVCLINIVGCILRGFM